MLDIIHTVPSIAPVVGGPSRSVPGICTALARQGDQVQIVSTYAAQRDNTADWFHSPHVQTTYVPSSLAFRRWWWSRDFGRILRSKITPQTVIHDHGLWWPSNTAAATVARENGVPLIISPRGMLEPWSLGYHALPKKIAWQLYEKRRLNSATLFHATSADEAQNIRRLGFRQPIAIIPNGVDVSDAMPRPAARTGEKTILFLSRIHPKKGLLNLVDALSNVSLNGWRVVIAGPDENGHQAEVNAAVIAKGLQEKILFVGSVRNNEKWAVYQSADLFVLPTFSENFGIVVAEALASGVPVITTAGTPWRDLESAGCGWYIEPTVFALTEALRSALKLSESERTAMGQNGIALVERKYTWQRIAEMMREAYCFIRHRPPSPPSFIVVD